MSEAAMLLTVLIISGLTLLGLAGVAIFLLRILSQKQNGESEDFYEIASSNGPLDNVITRLNFQDSLDSGRFATASQESALCWINQTLAARSADEITVVVNGITLLQSHVTMVVSASEKGQALIKESTASIARHSSGKALPLVTDVKTGQVVEIMKEVKGAKAMARLASLSAAIVGAAHIISGADIANRLKEVDAKINLLLAYRRIDEMAALERIYTSARELCAGPMSREKRWELWRLRQNSANFGFAGDAS